ncbi:DUF3048 domain-containing protein [Neobacillus ginsengisoli]|uniref:DUF3048 domain-containing protein n=1 Tax=Neobacillus ginsengisoli TaxID=904295 RepID=A0ABT9Y357_9BACI|nr:DUF3048 domain-containing protein [Neobacillus ginsengisoli]MDQ0201627.1 hypothetical protein [Neobacillus ginsengisoli]
MRKWAVAIIAVLLLLAGCSDKKAVKEPVKKEKEVTKPAKKEEEKNQYPYYFPLTGKGSQTQTDGRAIAVMVNNHPLARPQSGLNKADIVYEILAEGDITRFLAVFQSEKPRNIGPIRSARKYYMELAKGLDALYIHHGESPEAEEMLKQGYINDLDGMVYDGTLFQRASFRKAPHNSYITYENILKGVKLKKYSMDQTPPAFTFMPEEDSKKITGNDASSVMISYSSSHTSDSSFVFDATLGKYKRFSGSEQTVDLETKEPILLDNVFIVEAVHKIVDSGGHRSIDLVSGGRGYLLQMGNVNEVEWKNENGRIVPVKNGKVAPFVQGKTWVNVVPTNPGLEKSVSFNVKQ